METPDLPVSRIFLLAVDLAAIELLPDHRQEGQGLQVRPNMTCQVPRSEHTHQVVVARLPDPDDAVDSEEPDSEEPDPEEPDPG
jgi:hypothetical protein